MAVRKEKLPQITPRLIHKTEPGGRGVAFQHYIAFLGNLSDQDLWSIMRSTLI